MWMLLKLHGFDKGAEVLFEPLVQFMPEYSYSGGN